MSNKSFISKTKLDEKIGGTAFTLSSVISILASFIFSLMLVAIASSKNIDADAISKNTAVILISFLIGTVVCVSTIAICTIKFKLNLKPLYAPTKSKNNVLVYVCTLLIAVGVIFGLSELNVYFLEFLNSLGLTPSSPSLPEFSVVNFILVIICVCLLPAIFEETLFRGIITYSLKGAGEVFAILVSGALFAFFHMNPAQTLYQFVFGGLFAFIALRAGNLLPVIIAHFLNNLFVVVNYYFLNINFVGTTKIVVTVVAILMLITGVSVMAIFVKTESKKEPINKLDFVKKALIGIVVCVAMWLTNLV